MPRDADALLAVAKWAANGDVATPEEAGLVRTTGWPATYSATGGPRPQRELFNQMFRELYGWASEVNHHGALCWDASVAYPSGAFTYGSDARVYRAVAATTGDDPVDDDGSNWRPLVEEVGSTTRNASAERLGVVELATRGQARAGARDDLAVSPRRLSQVAATTAQAGLAEFASSSASGSGWTTAQSIAAPASVFFTGGTVVWHWDSVPGPRITDSRLLINASDQRYLRQLRLDRTSGEVQMGFTGTPTGPETQGFNLNAAWVRTGSIHIQTVGGAEVRIRIADADTTDEYVWTPANSADVIAFANAANAYGNQNARGAATLSFDVASPTGPSEVSSGVADKIVAPADISLPTTSAASTTTPGIVRLATNAQVDAGTTSPRNLAATPANVKHLTDTLKPDPASTSARGIVNLREIVTPADVPAASTERAGVVRLPRSISDSDVIVTPDLLARGRDSIWVRTAGATVSANEVTVGGVTYSNDFDPYSYTIGRRHLRSDFGGILVFDEFNARGGLDHVTFSYSGLPSGVTIRRNPRRTDQFVMSGPISAFTWTMNFRRWGTRGGVDVDLRATVTGSIAFR